MGRGVVSKLRPVVVMEPLVAMEGAQFERIFPGYHRVSEEWVIFELALEKPSPEKRGGCARVHQVLGPVIGACLRGLATRLKTTWMSTFHRS